MCKIQEKTGGATSKKYAHNEDMYFKTLMDVSKAMEKFKCNLVNAYKQPLQISKTA